MPPTCAVRGVDDYHFAMIAAVRSPPEIGKRDRRIEPYAHAVARERAHERPRQTPRAVCVAQHPDRYPRPRLAPQQRQYGHAQPVARQYIILDMYGRPRTLHVAYHRRKGSRDGRGYLHPIAPARSVSSSRPPRCSRRPTTSVRRAGGACAAPASMTNMAPASGGSSTAAIIHAACMRGSPPRTTTARHSTATHRTYIVQKNNIEPGNKHLRRRTRQAKSIGALRCGTLCAKKFGRSKYCPYLCIRY